MSDNNKTPISLDSIGEQRKLLEAQEMLQVNSLLKSTDPADIVKAQTYLQGIQKRQDNNFKSFVFSPEQEFYNSLGYKNQPTPTSYQTLRNMSRTVIMRSIITTRVDQVASFSEPTSDEQKVGWTIRKKRGIFDTKETKITEEDKRKIEDIIQFMLDSGINQNTWTNDNFDQFLRKITLDSLVLDQMTFECVRNRRGQLVEYIATDGGTMRLAEGYDDRNERVVGEFAEEINGYKPSYVQVYNQQVKNIYYPWELCFGIRNQTTSIQNNGYGISELEDLITIITYMLYGQLYNGNFFKQGSNPKGLLHIKGNLDAAKMAEFKQMWRSTVSGVSNAHKMPVLDGGNDIQFIDMQHCLHGDSEVYTLEGKKSLNELLKDSTEVSCELWDGIKFSNARVFKTKEKQICEITLNNNISIKTSPEHKFLTLRDNKPEWIERKNLILGDYVLINKNSISNKQEALLFNNIKVEEDLFELFGWITGDGYISIDENSKRYIRTFYHPTKEMDVVEKHLSTCLKYNINARRFVRRIDIDNQREWKSGIQATIAEQPYINISDAKFYNWFLSLGFTPSVNGKNIPDFLYSYNSNFKCAFLRGFFSADGHISINGSHISITISNPELKSKTRELLLTEGIRCTSYKRKKIEDERFNYPSEDNVLIIRDRDVFIEKVNFIQLYKQDREKTRLKTYYTLNEAPTDLIKHTAIQIRNFNRTLSIENKLSKKDLGNLLNISKGHQKASLTKVLSIGKTIGFVEPSFLNDFNLERITELSVTDEFVEMVDVEMDNENHQFNANGFIVHNSNKDMEFSQWQDFLTVVACSVYKIDPSEIGFNLQKGSSVFGQDGQKARLEHSQSKGLTPLLKFIQRKLTKYIVSQLDPKFEFVFTGIEQEDKIAALDMDVKKSSAGFVSQEDMFKKYSSREFNPDKDTILNPVYLQAQQMKQMGGQGSNEEVDQQTGETEGNSYNEDENPFAKSMNDYIDKQFTQEKIQL